MAGPKSQGLYWPSLPFRKKETSVDDSPEMPETLEGYLQLTVKCMEQARTMAPSLKFNHGQCKYLVEKLEVAIQSVRPLLEPFERLDHAGLAYYIQVFKFLFSLATEVESFIQICCEVAWIQAAISLTQVSQQVSFLGFNLEVFTVIFSKGTEQNGRRALTSTKVADISKAEVGTVKNKASLDEIKLLRKVKDFIKSSGSGKQRDILVDDQKLAAFLLERLRQSSAPNLPQESLFTGLIVKESLGRGSFATVYKAIWLGVTVAKKTFEGPHNAFFERELSILFQEGARLSHPNIIRWFGYVMQQRTCSIVMELMDGDLCCLIEERLKHCGSHGSPFTILEAIDIMHQVAEGVLYLHEQKIQHRDLKSANILFKLVKAGETKTQYVHVKVADLGVSKIKERSITSSNQTPNIGSPRWIAPEMILLTPEMMSSPLNSTKYPFKSDVYSFAMICYEIISGHLPFSSIESPKEVKELVLAGSRPPEFEDEKSPFDQCPIRLKTLIEKCWSQDPGARPSFRDICEDLRYLKCLLTTRLIETSGKLRGVISISSTGPNAEVTAVARNSKIEIGRGKFGPIYYEDVPDRQEVRVAEVRVAEGSHVGEEEFLNNEGHLLFKGVKMDVGAALEIIRDVNVKVDNVCVNKSQCKRLAERFCGIGKALEALMTEHNGDTFIETSSMDQILAVLKKGEDLIRDNADERSTLRNVFDEPFNEVHEEIDALGTFLDIDQKETNKLLNTDAEIDQREKLPKDTWKGNQSTVDGDQEGDVENMEKAVIEKCYNAEPNADDLSYLNIPFSEIQEFKPMSEWTSKADAHRDGLALVHKGRWNGCNCAIKVFKSAENREELHKEIASLVKLRHPHLTQLIGCAQHDDQTYVLYEMMDSNLRALMTSRKKERPLSRTEEFSIITQIAEGMFYLHEKGLVHGELECTNLLVKEVGDHIDVQIANFHWQVDQSSDALLMKGDVYSFAMTCYEVVTGKYSFEGEGGKALEEEMKAGERPELPEDLSKDLKRLITKCWHEDPEQRPSFQDICYVLKVVKPVDATVADMLGGRDWSVLPMRSLHEFHDAAKDLPQYLKIRPSDLKPTRLLGTGTSAEVFEASWIGCRFAVKWLKVDHVAKLRQEVSIMLKLLHPHVIRLVGFSVLKNRCAIVMELMDKSLRDLMNSRIGASKKKHPVPFSQSEALGIIRKLTLGMDFLHSRGVIHGDLKCAGLLVRNTNSKCANWDVKIADFGLSQLLEKCSNSHQSVGRWQGTLVGWWRAPEVIRMVELKETVHIDLKAADVYSFAMVCYEVITGKTPFQRMGYNTQKELAKAGGGPKLDNVKVQPKLKRLLEDCWSLQPEHRPKFDQISKRLTQMSTSVD